MDAHPKLLTVATSPALAESLIRWIVRGGYRPSVATTFESANRQLRTNPHLVITQLRLQEYNGVAPGSSRPPGGDSSGGRR